MSWLIDVLGVELAGVVGPDQIFSICESSWPIESLPVCFTRQRARGHVAGARSSMNFRQQLAPLLVRDASKLHPVFTPPIEIPIYQDVHLGLTGYTLSFFVILGKGSISQVLEQIDRPWWGLSFHC